MHSTIGFAMSDEASENKPDTKARLFETNPDLLQKDNEVKLELVQGSPDAEQKQDPFVGRTLLDKYEVLSFVGTGGMSTVYKARNKLLDSYCALKVLHKHLWQDPRAQERFRMEAKAINELMHPNLVTLKDYGVTSDGDPVLVMEFLNGTDLSKKITDEGRLPLDKVVEIFMALCKGLSQAHRKGIVHRDIKPANIMFDEHSISFDAGGVKLVDFGIAKIINDDVNEINKLTQTGEVFGSPFYMSPEQCMGEAIDQRSDVYALGCLIYEAITGQPPVYASAILDAFYKQVNEVPKPFQEVREEFKFQKEFDGVDLEDLQFIVFKCFEKVPSDRYQTVDEILVDLNRLVAKEKFTREEHRSVTLKAKEKSQPLSGKKRVALWLSAGFISVLLGVSLAFFSMYPQLQEAMGVRNSSKDSEQFDSIAFRYYQAGEYDKAITLLKFGVETYKENGNERLLGDNFKHIADCYRKKNEYREAVVYYEKAYRIYKKLKVYDTLSLACLEEYAETLEKLGQTELANEFKDKAAKRSF